MIEFYKIFRNQQKLHTTIELTKTEGGFTTETILLEKEKPLTHDVTVASDGNLILNYEMREVSLNCLRLRGSLSFGEIRPYGIVQGAGKDYSINGTVIFLR